MKIRPCLVFDIETRPDPRIWDDPKIVAEIMEGISAPSNYKDPVKIAAYCDEQGQKEMDKAALHATGGKVASIAYTMLGSGNAVIPAVAGEDEKKVLEWFARECSMVQAKYPTVGGFNVREFDIPFVTARCAVHNILLPQWWPAKRDWRNVVDPMDILGRDGTLNEWLRAFGLPVKSGSSKDSLGYSMDELRAYNQDDVNVTENLVWRLKDRFPALREDQY